MPPEVAAAPGTAGRTWCRLRWAWLALLPAGLLAVGALALRVVVVEGGSMTPAYQDADRLLVERLACRLVRPGRFAVVVAVEPTDPRRECVKRIVGLPGETVELRAGRLFVAGAEVPERFVTLPGAGDFGPVTVPEGAYFLLGDNRETSLDSRVWATQSPPVWVRGAMIRGRVLLRLSGR